jgi:hypothetical protein
MMFECCLQRRHGDNIETTSGHQQVRKKRTPQKINKQAISLPKANVVLILSLETTLKQHLGTKGKKQKNKQTIQKPLPKRNVVPMLSLQTTLRQHLGTKGKNTEEQTNNPKNTSKKKCCPNVVSANNIETTSGHQRETREKRKE